MLWSPGLWELSVVLKQELHPGRGVWELSVVLKQGFHPGRGARELSVVLKHESTLGLTSLALERTSLMVLHSGLSLNFFITCFCLCAHACCVPQLMCGRPRTTCMSCFASSAMWVPGVQLRSSGLGACPLPSELVATLVDTGQQKDTFLLLFPSAPTMKHLVLVFAMLGSETQQRTLDSHHQDFFDFHVNYKSS